MCSYISIGEIVENNGRGKDCLGAVNVPVVRKSAAASVNLLFCYIVQRAIVYVPLHYLEHLILQFTLSGCEHVDIDQNEILERIIIRKL